jgi:hypothetical protein
MGNGFSGFLLNPPSEIKLENLEERQRRYSIQWFTDISTSKNDCSFTITRRFCQFFGRKQIA